MGFDILFWVLCGIYLGGWFFCSIAFYKDKHKIHDIGERLLFIGLALHLFFMVGGYIELDIFPFETTSGLILFLSLLIILIYFIVDFYFPNEIFELIFPPITLFFLLLSRIISNQAFNTSDFLDTMPVFGKLILYAHGSFSMIGYILFGVACLTSIFFLYQEKQIKNKTLHLRDAKVPSLGFLDSLNYKVIATGFIFLTVALLLGTIMKVVIHMEHPEISLRQILPLITWLIYAIFLLDRSIRGLRGKISAIWAISGFVFSVGSFIYEISLIVSKS